MKTYLILSQRQKHLGAFLQLFGGGECSTLRCLRSSWWWVEHNEPKGSIPTQHPFVLELYSLNEEKGVQGAACFRENTKVAREKPRLIKLWSHFQAIHSSTSWSRAVIASGLQITNHYLWFSGWLVWGKVPNWQHFEKDAHRAVHSPQCQK